MTSGPVDVVTAAREARDRAEAALDAAQADVATLRTTLRAAEERVARLAQEVSGVRSQLIAAGYLTSSTGDVSDALNRALNDGSSARVARGRGEALPQDGARRALSEIVAALAGVHAVDPQIRDAVAVVMGTAQRALIEETGGVRLNTRPTPDLHLVTPLLGEPGLLIGGMVWALIDELDGRTPLVLIERKSLPGSPIVWEVRPAPKIAGAGPRYVPGWAEAMSAAVELAGLVRVYCARSDAAGGAMSALHEWSRASVGTAASTG